MEISLLSNHFKIALRNLRKNKFYSLINISGLALGLAAFVLVFTYTQYQSTFDQTHPSVDQLYRVNQTSIWNPQGGQMSSSAPPLAKTLEDNIPEVIAATRINTPGGRLVRYTPENGNVIAFNENDILAADSNFFDFFDFPLQLGNPKTALKGVNKMVISPEMAQKYFGTAPALGKVLYFGEDRIPMEVSGVTEEQKDNIHFDFDFLMSMSSHPEVKERDWSWIWTQVVTYVQLDPKADPEAVNAKLTAIGPQFVKPTMSRFGIDYDEFIEDKGGWNFYLQAVPDIHLQSAEIGNRIGTIGNVNTVRLLRIIALFILLIAVLNFVNLATARASTRTKEIGVKKTLGALRKGLIQQFLVESVTITIVAAILGVGLMLGLMEMIDRFTNIQIPLNSYLQGSWIAAFLALPILVGLIAGMYPAFILSSIKPIRILKDSISGGMKNPLLRNILVTAQFTISIALIAGTVMVYQQLQFLQNQDLGFDQENILVINNAHRLGNQLESFRNEVQSMSQVAEASMAMDVPGRGSYEDFYRKAGSEEQLSISQIKIDEYYFPTLNFNMAAGRTFEEGRTADNNAIVINETTARLFNWTNEDALGKIIYYPGDNIGDLEVIGVVEDFHFQSMRQEIRPLMFINLSSNMWGDRRVVAIKYQMSGQEELLASLESSWNKMTDDIPFEYSFYDEELAMQYEAERSMSSLFTIFSGFSLFIAVIGLIGLLTFSTGQRKKEISIRKILGASKMQIFQLLNGQYLLLFVIALLLAIPLSWQSMQSWLNSFAYRIDVSLLFYLIAGSIVILLSLLSVSYLSLKIANTNPAEVLADE